MKATQKIPSYKGKTRHKKRKVDVAIEEIRQQNEELKLLTRKKRELKKKYAVQKARRKQAEQLLEQERADTAERERKIRLQTKLDALTFYREKGAGAR